MKLHGYVVRCNGDVHCEMLFYAHFTHVNDNPFLLKWIYSFPHPHWHRRETSASQIARCKRALEFNATHTLMAALSAYENMKSEIVNFAKFHHVRKCGMKNALDSWSHIALSIVLAADKLSLLFYVDVYLLHSDTTQRHTHTPSIHPSLLISLSLSSSAHIFFYCYLKFPTNKFLFHHFYFRSSFRQVYVPTGFEKYSKKYKVREYTVQYSIWDTSGELNFWNWKVE